MAWRLFWALAVLQAVDLLTTYLAFSRSGAREGNVLLRPFIYTPAAPALKTFAIIFLALLVIGSSTRGRPAPRRLTAVMWVILAAYVVITLNNVHILLYP